MRKLFIVQLLFPFLILGQDNFEQQLDSVTSMQSAKVFLENNSSSKGKVFVFNKEKHKTKLADELFSLSKGGKKIVSKDYKSTYYKILDKNEVIHYRVHYIMLDGKQMDLSKIMNLRQKIISNYKKGYAFKSLAKYYSMDTNAKRGGDSGWLTNGSMSLLLEDAIASYETNSIFTVDVTEEDKYYVVLKSHDAEPIEEITVLKVTQTK